MFGSESRISLKPVLGRIKVVALSTNFHEQTRSQVIFFNIVGSLFLKDPFYKIILEFRVLNKIWHSEFMNCYGDRNQVILNLV